MTHSSRGWRKTVKCRDAQTVRPLRSEFFNALPIIILKDGADAMNRVPTVEIETYNALPISYVWLQT